VIAVEAQPRRYRVPEPSLAELAEEEAAEQAFINLYGDPRLHSEAHMDNSAGAILARMRAQDAARQTELQKLQASGPCDIDDMIAAFEADNGLADKESDGSSTLTLHREQEDERGSTPTEPVRKPEPYTPPKDLPGVRNLASVPRLNRDYLDYLRMPRGVVTQCIGDSGAGKGAVLFDIAARVTRGDVTIDGSARYQTGNVLILSAEEEAEYAISKRLDAAGAISERVFVVDEQITFPSGWKRLAELVEHYGAVFVIVDGLFDFLDEGISPISTAHMRRVTDAYGKVARKTQCAIVPVQHIGQGKRNTITQLANNSNAVTAYARSALYVARVPDSDVRVLTQFKNSDGPLADSLTFTIEPVPGDDLAFRVVWGDATTLTATDLMPGEYKPEKAEQEARPEDYVLRAYMDANNWDVEPKDALKHLQAAGFPRYTSPSGQAVQGLRLRVGIQPVKLPGFPAKTRWRSKSNHLSVSD
jgi:hypothetical protein